jgi:non-homologous end joining protein Ku
MAGQLVEALAAEPDLDGYRDQLRDRVLELVESKRDGEDLVPVDEEAPAPSDDGSLRRLLKQSLAEVGGGGA